MSNFDHLLYLFRCYNIILSNKKINPKSAHILKKYPELYAELYCSTSFLEEGSTVLCRIVAIINEIHEHPKCVVCGKHTNFNPKTRTFAKYCPNKKGQSCIIRDESLNQKRKQTMLNRYGVESPQQSNEIKQKTKNTNIERYGGVAPMSSQYVKDKAAQTNLERYGATNSMQNEKVRKKVTQTMIERYGTKTYAESLVPIETFQMLQDKQWCIDSCKDFTTLEIALNLGCSTSLVRQHLKNHDIDVNIIRPTSSHAQREIARWLYENHVHYIENDKSILKTHEVDILIPNKNLALEYDGIYFHTEKTHNKDKTYHINKTNKCEYNNIHLIHIWSNEWNKNKDAIKSKILHYNGIFEEKVYARKCNVVKLTSDQLTTFIEDNSFKCVARSNVQYGLVFEGKLVGVMCFTKINKLDNWEIVEFVLKKFWHIPGGFSKVLKQFIRDNNPKIINIKIDRRWGSNGCIEKVEFKKVFTTPPTHYYINLKGDTNVLFSKHNFQKNKLRHKIDDFDPNKTEWENMKANGYDRIWDCGFDVWQWEQIT